MEPKATPARVRPAKPQDAPRILELVRELAAYEREPDAVEASLDDVRTALFGPQPRVHCLVAELDEPHGPVVAGMALWFVTFSTWRGRHGLWLEDLFVSPSYRREGVGRALLAQLAGICRDRGYARLEWQVLDWNVAAQDFYASLGAAPQDGWTVWRVDRDALARLAGDTP